MAPVRTELESLAGGATVVVEDCVLPVDLGSVVGTSTQLMSESLSLSHISTSESEVAHTGWSMPSAGGVGSDELPEDASVLRLDGSTIG